jgi:hypothetical protein
MERENYEIYAVVCGIDAIGEIIHFESDLVLFFSSADCARYTIYDSFDDFNNRFLCEKKYSITLI